MKSVLLFYRKSVLSEGNDDLVGILFSDSIYSKLLIKSWIDILDDDEFIYECREMITSSNIQEEDVFRMTCSSSDVIPFYANEIKIGYLASDVYYKL